MVRDLLRPGWPWFRFQKLWYTSTKILVCTIELNDVHYFTLIRYSDSYHIIVSLPRPVIRNESDIAQ